MQRCFACRTLIPFGNLPASCPQNLPPAALCGYGYQCSPFSLCERETETKGWVLPPLTKDGENANGDLPLGSKGGQPGSRALRRVQLPLISAVPASSMTTTEYSTITPESRGLSGRRCFCRIWPHRNGKTGKFSGTPWRKTRKPRTAALPVSLWWRCP